MEQINSIGDGGYDRQVFGWVSAIPSSSGLDFGPINAGTKNTIYYALKQRDGVYQYQLKIESGLVLSGKCGYVKNNEVHKRVVLLVKENQVTCQSRASQN
ncbi:hypothetical protein AC626_08470 [Pseudoalteromonas rubra]|uniref:Uncharacterized protein n=1 Tax=Pseudoalteromonas rubra TaxID=43658 RepID=A0A0L0ETR3_9GAMM|nr:hypothetical protein AC626_08470 [Pseudoalteromonas rubra]